LFTTKQSPSIIAKNSTMASIHCMCGEVEIKFTSQCPRVAIEACDNQAFNKVRFLAEMGEYEIPEKFPVLVYYFENRMFVVKGVEKLCFYKLIAEANIVNMYASCCHTFLMSRHPLFGQTAVSVLASEDYRSCFTNIVHQKPILRFFGNQLPEEERQQLNHDIPDLSRDAKDAMKGDRDGWEGVLHEFLAKVSVPIVEGLEGKSFEQILEDSGESVLVLGWQSSRFAKKTVALHEKVDRRVTRL
jgi:hypothetical protein